MNLLSFFKGAVKAERLKEKSWLLRAFSITQKINTLPDNVKPFDIYHVEDNLVFIGDDQQPVKIEDYVYNKKNPEPAYHVKDVITITTDDLVNVNGSIETTIGNVVANWLLCIYPFGNKIPFIEGRFGIRDVEKYIERLFTDDPVDGVYDESKIYYDEYTKYRRAAGIIDGLTQICVPSATEKTLTHHPDRDKLRKELIEKYKDKLHDPGTAAKISAELKALDLEWLKGDRAMGFFVNSKSLDVVRMKTHGMIGLEQAFTDVGVEGDYIDRSLSDGWDITKMTAMANSIREGSFDRGAQTALGGEATKFILRVMQNAGIEEKDCGTKLGIDVEVTKQDRDALIGNYHIVDGKIVLITEESFNSLVGKTINMRTTAYCRSKFDNFCETCLGERYASNKTALATAAANVGSTFMLVFMKSMHGVALKTVKYDYKQHLK